MSDTYLIDSRNLIYHFKRVTELLSINGVWKGDRREENYKFIPKFNNSYVHLTLLHMKRPSYEGLFYKLNINFF